MPICFNGVALLVNIKEQIDNSLSVWYSYSVILFPCGGKFMRRRICSYETFML